MEALKHLDYSIHNILQEPALCGKAGTVLKRVGSCEYCQTQIEWGW